MRIFRYILGYAFAALACLGFGSLAIASDDLPRHVAHAVATAGSYGEASAKAHVELTYMVSLDSVSAVSTGNLVADGNGFLQARADATVGQGVGNQVELS